MIYDRDYFVCHATPDKAVYARPLVKALEASGISCWLDEAEVLPGDSISAAIDQGLEASQFVVALLTPRSVGRNWSEYELRLTLARQIEEGRTRLVPIVADFDAAGISALTTIFPSLRDRFRLAWEDGLPTLVASLEARLHRVYNSLWEFYHEPVYGGPVWFSVITERPVSVLRVHARWGRWHWSWSGAPSGGRGPIVFTHLKAPDPGDAIKLLITTDPPALVRFGVGQPPGGSGDPTGRWWGPDECSPCPDRPHGPTKT